MISHPLNQDFVAVLGEVFARPAAVTAVRAQSFCLAAEQKAVGTALVRAEVRMERSVAARAADPCDGSVSVECRKQDRYEGTGLRACAFPFGAAEPRLFGALCAESARRGGARRWRHGSARRLREAHRTGGPFRADGGRHVVLRLR